MIGYSSYEIIINQNGNSTLEAKEFIPAILVNGEKVKGFRLGVIVFY